ncbi:MAG: hypothetical protein ACJAVK_001913 [Akkermansiaceae bacterium]|jgi:hypothetical protein
MKYAKFAAVVFVLYFLGYVLGPTLTPMLVKPQEKALGLIRDVKYKGAIYTINLAEFRDSDLPTTLTIENPTEILTEGGNGTVKLRKGDTVALLNLKDDVLFITKDDANGKGTVAPDDTDLWFQLAKQVYDKEAGNAVAKVQPPVAPPTTVATPTPPPVVVAPTPAPTPTPMPVVVVPAPAPTPAPVPAGGGKLSDEEIIEVMKKSIAGGAVKEFTIDQIKENGWKVNGDETIDGTEYQTGLAAYEAATIFGVRPVQAKALIKGGKVERWVYAKSGMEIQ